MARGRVQAPELAGPVPLRSPGVPGDTFTGAAQAPIDNNLSRIADALQGFNSALSSFGSGALKKQQEMFQARETARIEGDLAGMNPQQIIEYRHSPNYQPSLDPHARGVEASVYGRSHSESIKAGIDQQISAGTLRLDDPNFNATQLVGDPAKAAVAEIQKRYASDPLSMKLAMENLRKGVDGLYLQYGQAAMKARNEQIMTTNMGAARQFLDSSMANGQAKPEDVVRMWNAVTTELGPKGSANIPNAAMKGIKLDLLENAASDPKKVALVEPLLKTQVAEGVPSLWDDASVSNRVLTIRDRMKKTLATNWETNANTAMEDAAFEALRQQDGSIAAVQPRREKNPVSGEWATIGEGAQSNAAKRYFTWSQNDAAVSQRDPSIVLDREINVSQQSNIPIPHVKQTLDNSVNRALDGSFSGNYKAREEVLSAYRTWNGMVRNNRPWTETQMKLNEPTKEFFTAMDVATGYMGLPADAAMDLSADIVRNPLAKEDPKRLERKLIDIESQVSKLRADAPWYDFWSSSTPYNDAAVLGKVEAVAKLLGRSSQINTDQAIKAAKEFVEKTTFQVNGSAVSVPNMSEADGRKYLNAQIDKLLPDIKKRYDTKDLSRDDIAVYEKGDGTYGLRNKKNSLPIRLPTTSADGTQWSGEITITPQMLTDMKQLDQVQTRERLKAETHANSRQSLIDAHDALDTRERGLDNGGLGGVFYQTQKRKIAEERAKLPKRPEPGEGRPIEEPWLLMVKPN